ncbi:hypothetical protein [Modestobacter sp. SYSU DS0290]
MPQSEQRLRLVLLDRLQFSQTHTVRSMVRISLCVLPGRGAGLVVPGTPGTTGVVAAADARPVR